MHHIVVGTAGHIDHGKSALVRVLTGTDPDRLKEERDRGITIDLGFAHLELGGVRIAFVDVPGHERFVKNMLAGATGIDAVLLVVAADESVMPQTREHFDICRLLHVPAGLVALTKSDLADADTIDLVSLEIRELVAGSFLEHAPIVPVSARTGAGLEELRRHLEALGGRVPARGRGGVARLPVDRVFSVKGFGTVVTGTVTGGTFRVDDDVMVMPAGRRVKVRGLQAHGRSAEAAGTGQRLAVNLAGIDVGEIARGAALVTPGALEPTRRFDAVIDLLPSARALRHGARVRFHHGTSEVLGRVAVSGSAPRVAPSGLAEGDIAAQRRGATEVEPGGRAHVRVRLEAPAVLTRGDRFILRAYSPPVTIAGGLVLDPQPPRGGTRTPAARSRFWRLDPGTRPLDDPSVLEATLTQLLDERAGQGLATSDLVARVGLAPDAAPRLVEQLVAGGAAVHAGPALVSGAAVATLERHLLDVVAEHHRALPLSDGLPREEARERVFSRAHPAVFDVVMTRLGSTGRLVGTDRLALATHRVTLSPAHSDALDRVERAFREAGLRPPDAAGLAGELGLPAAQVDQSITLLVRQKRLVRIETLWFHSEALARLKLDVAGLKRGTDPARVDVATFKQRYGISRKYAIPLLEFLDRERVTRRVGEARLVL